MNRYLKTTIASTFALSLLAGTALAQAADSTAGKDRGPSPEDRQEMMIDETNTGSVSPNLMTGEDIGGWQTGAINVVQISTLNDNDPNRTMLEDRANANAEEVSALQQSIEANSALKSQLEAQNVQINNVVAAEKAADGSVTFYVR